MNTQAFSISEALRSGWETFKKRPFLIIGAFLVTGMVNVIFQSVFGPDESAEVPNIPLVVLFVLIGIMIGTLMEIGMTTFSLKAHDSIDTLVFKDIWNPKPFVKYLLAKVFTTIIILVGFLLLIVPGVIVSLGLMFSLYLVIDKDRGPIEAVKESWRITKGHKGRLLLFGLALAGINILGFLALIVGLLVTVPVSMLASVYVYRKLEQANAAATPVSL